MIGSIEFSQVNSLEELINLLKANGVPAEEFAGVINSYHGYKARQNFIPLSGQFELTPLCNLDCKMCYVHMNAEQVKASGAKILTTQQWKDIMQQAFDCGMRYACLTGGECLSYPGFQELYEFLYGLGVHISIKTNGVLLNEEFLDLFKRCPPSMVTITLYGSCDYVYEIVCGVLAYDKVIGAIKALKEIGLPLGIALTPNEFMGDDIFRCIDLVHELDVTTFINTFLLPERSGTGREVHELSPERYAEILKYNYLLNGGRLATEEEIAAMPCYQKSESAEAQYGIRCSAGRSSFSVTWEGLMCPCTNLGDINASLLTSDFKSAWTNMNKAVLRILLPTECESCSYKDLCIPCIAVHNIANNIGHCNQNVCALTTETIKLGIVKSKR